MRLRLGTRGSALAVAQSEQVAELVRAMGHDVDLVRIKTLGDVTTTSLASTGSLGVFAAELRTALLDGRVDFAVHSLKDLPTEAVPGLQVAAIPHRGDPRDALCARDGLGFTQLPVGATIGSGSPRRVAQLRRLRPDLRYVDVRGNVGTRLARVTSGDLDAVVLAAAGLARLGMAEAATDYLPILPAPGQGALALECRSDDLEIRELLAALDDPQTRLAVEQERHVLAELGGGCAAPIAAWGHEGQLSAGVFALDGLTAAESTRPLTKGAGAETAAALLDAGAAEVADLGARRPSRLAELHDDSSLWSGDTVLAGTRVLLPRVDGQLAEGIRAAGAEVVAEPLQRRVPILVDNWPDEADWVALTSAATLDALREQDLHLPVGAKIAVVGEATAQAVRAHGLDVALTPEGAHASARALAAIWPDEGRTVLIPGSARSSGELATALTAKGFDVTAPAVYTVETLDRAPDWLKREYLNGAFDVVVITSGSVGEAVDELLGWPGGVRVIAFGEPSATALRSRGIEPDAVAETQDAAGVIAAIGR